MLPNLNETREDFYNRFVKDKEMIEKFPLQTQREDVAKEVWNAREKKTYDLNEVEIFKAGHWNGDEYTEGDIEELEKNFSELSQLVKPYLKLGHDNNQTLLQKDGYPSAGWITNVKKKGKSLFADIKNIPEKVYELINRKAYGRFSPEIFIGLKHGEKKYGKVLKALSLLGAQTPAIMELGDFINLYENYNYDAVKIYDSWSEKKMEDKKKEEVKTFEAEYQTAIKEKEQISKAYEELQAKVSGIEKQRKSEKIEAMLKKFSHEGKILPSQIPIVSALIADMGDVKEFEYVENNEKKKIGGDPIDMVEKLFSLNPKIVEFGATSHAGDKSFGKTDFNAMDYSEQGEYIDKKTKELMKEDKNLSYVDAYKQVAREIGR